MRTRRVVVAGLLLLLATAGCGAKADDGGGVATAQDGTASAAPSRTPDQKRDEDAPIKFAQCMREQGLTWFPDPDTNGRTIVKTPKDLDPKKFDAAREACKEFAPDGGDPGEMDPAMLEMARKMAKCMRENGVPDFPDPQPNGSISLDRGKLGTGPGEPAFDKAQEKCSQYLPEGRQEHSERVGGGNA
ncbi:hypothetical protein [Actinoplanes solisilvae]|uniref:hypothetical protein n=1 Tax=Actinoplanes solisilvae TaxID=2486853 RepID=UPI000FDC7B77|nr:hypothetical protein [Actinoplanes solisilvae]